MFRKLFVVALAVAGGLAGAAPPTLTIPPDKLAPVSGYIRFSPDTNAKSVVYVALDDAYPFPSEELKDSRRFVLPVQGLKDGAYRFVAVGTLNDEQTATPFVVTIGKKQPPPVDPVDPPPPQGGKFYFVLVRADGPVSPEVKAVTLLPAWDELRKLGHEMKDYPVSQTPAGVPRTVNTLTKLRVSADGKSTTVVGQPLPLPKSDPAVMELVK